jgi:hypothetical protein
MALGSSKIREAVSNETPCFRRLIRSLPSSQTKSICIYKTVAQNGNIGPSCGVQPLQMSLPRSRWLLPIGNLVIDSIVLALWIWHADGLLMHHHRSGLRSSVHKPIVFLQETVTFDVRDIEPDPVFLFLISGNVPAALVSASARPHAHLQTRAKLWDPIWFAIHESISFLVWWLIGMLLDLGRFHLKKTILGFLAARLVVVRLLVWSWVTRLAGVLEIIFWLVLAIYAIVWIVRWLFRVTFRASVPGGYMRRPPR